MEQSAVSQAIAQIQQGHCQVREEIIKKYLPFILKVASRACKRYVYLGEDDEVSIALMGFNEALDKYDEGLGTPFFSFAETVMKRRIIDYFRSNGQKVKEIPWSALGSTLREVDIPVVDSLTWKEASYRFVDEEIAYLRKEEIREYSNLLAEYNITFHDLVDVSPKHKDARQTAYRIARLVYENKEFISYLTNRKSLPLKELQVMAGVSRKTLERQRKYIIALALIMKGEFYFLNDYLQGMKG